LRLNENLGWFYSVTNGWMNISPCDGGFYCLHSDVQGGLGGLAMWHVKNTVTRDPNECVRKQLKCSREAVNKLVLAVDSCDRLVRGAA